MLYKLWLKNKNLQHDNKATQSGEAFSVWDLGGHVAYEDIKTSTEDFDIKCCIGISGYGTIYRAQLLDGKTVALKKLHCSQTKELALRKSFMEEVKTLLEIRQRNTVKLHGYVSTKEICF